MLRARLMTAAVAIPLLLWVIYRAPLWFLGVVVLLLTLIALREFAAMALAEYSGAATMVTAGGMTIALTMALGQSGASVSAGIVICLAGVLIRTLWTATEMQESVNVAGHILLGSLYGGLLLPHLIWVRALPVNGSDWVTFILAVCMAGDAGGYFGGRAFGRRKLWPKVSPNKTVEGSVASFISSLAVAIIINAIALKVLGPVEVLVVAAIVNILAQLGDLLESMLKRAYDAEDSGWIFPGHGGVLDRTDSLVLPIVFIYYYARLNPGYLGVS